MMGTPLQLALRRWLDLAIVAAVATSALVVVVAVLPFDTRRLVGWPLPVLGAALTCMFLIATVIAWGRVLAFLGLRHIATYPPLWIAWVTGASGLLLALGLSEELRLVFHLSSEDSRVVRSVGIMGLLVTAVLFGASLVYLLGSGRNVLKVGEPPKVDNDNPDNLATLQFEQLSKWIRDDTAVRDQRDEMFGHSRIAYRIASRLQTSPPPAQAVVGRLGAGKTTLRELVDARLRLIASSGGKNVRLVPVELWPFETPRAAVEGVIRALVRTVEAEVSVLALRGLPESYSDAMSAAGGVWSAIARLHGRPASPLEALARIDRIATAIHRSYVVWVEDLERFAGTAYDESESAAEVERLITGSSLLLTPFTLRTGLEEQGSRT